MTLTKAQADARSNDQPHDQGAITKVDKTKGGFSVQIGSTGFMIASANLGKRKPPQVGDEVALYTRNWSWIRGVDLRGEPLYYKTDAELDIENAEARVKRDAETRKRFEKDRRKLDRQFAALPDVFQRRISWFRAWNPDFRWDLEAYEMSVCIDAVKIAEVCGTPAKVRKFGKDSHKKQLELVPDLYDGHSGNSFAAAVNLAALYLQNPLYAIAEHGALTPLTGCEEYGCAHPRPQDVMDAIEASKEEAA